MTTMEDVAEVRKAAATFEYPGYRADAQNIWVAEYGMVRRRWVLHIVEDATGIETFMDPLEWVKKWQWLQHRGEGGLWDQYGEETA